MYVCGVISLLVHQWDDCQRIAVFGWSGTIGGLLTQIECAQNILSLQLTRHLLGCRIVHGDVLPGLVRNKSGRLGFAFEVGLGQTRVPCRMR